MNLGQVTAIAAAVADVVNKGSVLRGEGLSDSRPSLHWDPGDKERMLALVIKHIYPDVDIETVLADIQEKYNEQ